jgi:hypothetical protein
MKLLKSLVLLACMQITTIFAMEGIAIQGVDEGAASASNNTAAFASMAPLGKAIEEISEPSVPVIIGRIFTQDGRVASIVKDYTKRDILAGLEKINTCTSALIELLKTEEPEISHIMSVLSTIVGDDILTLKPHLLQVVWALYNPEPVQMVASNVGTSKDELPRIEELGDEDL